MKRVKTKHKNAERRKAVRQVTDDVVGYILPLFYIAMKDELGLSVEEVRRVKETVDRYSDYLSQGLITFNDIKKGFEESRL